MNQTPTPLFDDKAVLAVGENLPVATTPPDLMTIIDRAVEKLSGEHAGSAVDALGKLLDMHRAMMADQALADFNVAMAEFQAECPNIPKTSKGKVTTKSGGEYQFEYAELDQIRETVGGLLSKHGFSYSWDVQGGGSPMVVCTLRHKAGHQTTSSFPFVTETAAAMSGAQKAGSALTYAKRYSLIAVLGLTTCDPDDDAAVPKSEQPRITEEQARNIESLVAEVKADLPAFLRYMGAARIIDIPVSDFPRAINALESKRRRTT
jgi:hypothetical protein